LDLSLQLFARDHLNLALIDFLGSTPGLLDPKLPNLLFWKLIQAVEEDLHKVRAVLQWKMQEGSLKVWRKHARWYH